MKDITDTEGNEMENSRAYQADAHPMKKPVTNIIPDHSKATARIFIEGLSVLCLNETDKTAEIAFVKDHHTPVFIGVYKRNCEPYWKFKCDINQKTKIEIKKTSHLTVGEFYEDRKKDKKDFAWMPDLTAPDWHNGAAIGIQTTAKEHLSAKLVLQDAIFYTELNCLNKAEQKNVHSGVKKDLPNLGRVLGANIICEATDTAVVITVTTKDAGGNDVVVDRTLPKSEGPFFIAVATKPELGMDGDHLHLLYDHIITLPPGEPRFGLQYIPAELPFNYCGVFNTVSAENDTSISVKDTEVSARAHDAKNAGKTKTGDIEIESIEFACQTYGGGGGPLPPFP